MSTTRRTCALGLPSVVQLPHSQRQKAFNHRCVASDTSLVPPALLDQLGLNRLMRRWAAGCGCSGKTGIWGCHNRH